jgi:hypothetical protein
MKIPFLSSFPFLSALAAAPIGCIASAAPEEEAASPLEVDRDDLDAVDDVDGQRKKPTKPKPPKEERPRGRSPICMVKCNYGIVPGTCTCKPMPRRTTR